MEQNLNNEQLTEAIAEVGRRASVDLEFRALALKNAKEAIAKVTTKKLSTDFDIKFIDNSGSVKSLILPDPVPALEELSDLEMEMVAGGGDEVEGDFSVGQAQSWPMG